MNKKIFYLIFAIGVALYILFDLKIFLPKEQRAFAAWSKHVDTSDIEGCITYIKKENYKKELFETTDHPGENFRIPIVYSEKNDIPNFKINAAIGDSIIKKPYCTELVLIKKDKTKFVYKISLFK